MIKLQYPLPNMVRVYANDRIVDPIIVTSKGLRRNINTSQCGDNYYFYNNRTINFILT